MIDVMLSNEKYAGDVKPLKSGKSVTQYLPSDNDPAIISKKVFETMQLEKTRKSDVMKDNGNQGKSSKYSSKAHLK